MWLYSLVLLILILPDQTRTVLDTEWPTVPGWTRTLTAGEECDTGEHLLEVDLPSPKEVQCTGPPWPPPEERLPSVNRTYSTVDGLPVCMNKTIQYPEGIPNSGKHRPVGAQYGEYIYCPPQRWIRNLKDGGIAFLYHPCVHPVLKAGLVALARSCYCNHIITPYPTLSHERPLALAAWGRTLEMSHIDHKEIGKWIPVRKDQKEELRSNKEKRYKYLLIRKSEMLLDKDGSAPCPFGNLTKPNSLRWTKQDLGLSGGRRYLKKRNVTNRNETYTNVKSGSGILNRHNQGKLESPAMQVKGLHQTVYPKPGRAASKAGSPSSGAIQVDSAKESHQIGQQLPLQDGGGNHRSENETGLRGEQEKNSGCPHMAAPPFECDCAEKMRLQKSDGAMDEQRSVHLPTPRTEEAAWAAAALGFLLVILTLAILHTRLYRGCQRGPSLYWPAQQHEFHEYDSVAEIVKRRMQLGGRRKRKPLKARKEEHSMLINSSSDDSD
ncbi:tumor protein p53-inducible protein 13 isoform X2 [Polypterus senegalus]|uniref:tumor protein p53-inducible protein 13 isoform X2 n=1 Tax=Polypterus senegalus TaxID=55291 RepID=UPI0019628CEB|nr:tumor protein p53-inducible protein 13 isoform X2 [Polypterus senegalus]